MAICAPTANIMSQQLSLPGLNTTSELLRPDPSRAKRGGPLAYKLFLALFPAPGEAQHIARYADELCLRYGMVGPRLATGRLHITLHGLGDFRDAVPRAVVDAAIAAAATITCPPLHIVFDHALSFTRNDGFVLGCDAGSSAAIARLQQTLALALRRVGLRPAPSRSPHMTLLYDPRHIAECSIGSIQWTASEFALILSHVGQPPCHVGHPAAVMRAHMFTGWNVGLDQPVHRQVTAPDRVILGQIACDIGELKRQTQIGRAIKRFLVRW